MNYDLVVIGSAAAGHHGTIQAANWARSPGGGAGFVLRRSLHQRRNDSQQALREAVLRLTKFRERGHDSPLAPADRERTSQQVASSIEQVASEEGTIFADQFRRNGVDTLTGAASFVDPHTIQGARRKDRANGSR